MELAIQSTNELLPAPVRKTPKEFDPGIEDSKCLEFRLTGIADNKFLEFRPNEPKTVNQNYTNPPLVERAIICGRTKSLMAGLTKERNRIKSYLDKENLPDSDLFVEMAEQKCQDLKQRRQVLDKELTKNLANISKDVRNMLRTPRGEVYDLQYEILLELPHQHTLKLKFVENQKLRLETQRWRRCEISWARKGVSIPLWWPTLIEVGVSRLAVKSTITEEPDEQSTNGDVFVVGEEVLERTQPSTDDDDEQATTQDDDELFAVSVSGVTTEVVTTQDDGETSIEGEELSTK